VKLRERRMKRSRLVKIVSCEVKGRKGEEKEGRGRKGKERDGGEQF
jgi:hypothetical protein